MSGHGDHGDRSIAAAVDRMTSGLLTLPQSEGLPPSTRSTGNAARALEAEAELERDPQRHCDAKADSPDQHRAKPQRPDSRRAR
jgi:hypothetical protein